MQTTHSEAWGTRNVSFWLTLSIALGIILVGVRFIIDPSAGAAGFGIPFAVDGDMTYGRIKGVRDIFSGVVLVPLLFLRMRRETAWVFSAAIMVPAGDFLIVLATNGAGDVQHLLIHGLTVVYMIFTSWRLFKG